MRYMNRYDVDRAVSTFSEHEILGPAAPDKVVFKDEDEINGESIGPVWLVHGEEYTLYKEGPDPAVSEWFPVSDAEALAERLGVPLECV